jgi:hypothetical protein
MKTEICLIACYVPPPPPRVISGCLNKVDLILLKVHRIENLFGSKFEFCTISLIVLLKYQNFVKKQFFDWAMNGGDTIVPRSLRLRGIEFSLV